MLQAEVEKTRNKGRNGFYIRFYVCLMRQSADIGDTEKVLTVSTQGQAQKLERRSNTDFGEGHWEERVVHLFWSAQILLMLKYSIEIIGMQFKA